MLSCTKYDGCVIFNTHLHHFLCAAAIGYFSGDVRQLSADALVLRPTMYVGVPRVFERMAVQVGGKLVMKSSECGVQASMLHSAYNSRFNHLTIGIAWPLVRASHVYHDAFLPSLVSKCLLYSCMYMSWTKHLPHHSVGYCHKSSVQLMRHACSSLWPYACAHTYELDRYTHVYIQNVPPLSVSLSPPHSPTHSHDTHTHTTRSSASWPVRAGCSVLPSTLCTAGGSGGWLSSRRLRRW